MPNSFMLGLWPGIAFFSKNSWFLISPALSHSLNLQAIPNTAETQNEHIEVKFLK